MWKRMRWLRTKIDQPPNKKMRRLKLKTLLPALLASGISLSAAETILFQDRLTGVVDVHYATVSNRMNQVMKVLTVMSTIFLPLTVLTGMWGMNIPVPHFFGAPESQFWWILALMLGISLAMIVVFRRNDWI